MMNVLFIMLMSVMCLGCQNAVDREADRRELLDRSAPHNRLQRPKVVQEFVKEYDLEKTTDTEPASKH